MIGKKKVYIEVDIKHELPEDHNIYFVICYSYFNDRKQRFYQLAAYSEEFEKWSCETNSIHVTHWLKEESLYVFTKDELEAEFALKILGFHRYLWEHSDQNKTLSTVVEEYIKQLNIE